MEKMFLSLGIASSLLPFLGTYQKWNYLYKLLNFATFKFWLGHQKFFKSLLKSNKHLVLGYINQLIKKEYQRCYSKVEIEDGRVRVSVNVKVSPDIEQHQTMMPLSYVDVIEIILTKRCHIQKEKPYGSSYKELQTLKRILEINVHSRFEHIHLMIKRSYHALSQEHYEMLSKMSKNLTIEWFGGDIQGNGLACNEEGSYTENQENFLINILAQETFIDTLTIINYRLPPKYSNSYALETANVCRIRKIVFQCQRYEDSVPNFKTIEFFGCCSLYDKKEYKAADENSLKLFIQLLYASKILQNGEEFEVAAHLEHTKRKCFKHYEIDI